MQGVYAQSNMEEGLLYNSWTERLGYTYSCYTYSEQKSLSHLSPVAILGSSLWAINVPDKKAAVGIFPAETVNIHIQIRGWLGLLVEAHSEESSLLAHAVSTAAAHIYWELYWLPATSKATVSRNVLGV